MSLRALLLWTAALAVTAVLVYRYRRQRVVVLPGTWSPRLVRHVAVLVVALGLARVEAAEPEPAPTCVPTEPVVAQRPRLLVVSAPLAVPEAVAAPAGLHRLGVFRSPRSPWTRLKQAVDRAEAAPPDTRAARWADVALASSMPSADLPGAEVLRGVAEKLGRGEPATLADADAFLTAAEAGGVVDGWLVGFVFRLSRPAASAARPSAEDTRRLAALYGRLEQHARLNDAIARAGQETGPITYRPWLKKSGPPPGWVDVEVPEGMPKAIHKAAKTATAGTWATEATVTFDVRSGAEGLTLHRAGQAVPLREGTRVRLGRLDVLAVSGKGHSVIEIPGLGRVLLPPGAVTAWNIGELLPETARARVEAWVEKAATCRPGESVRELEAVLPVAIGALDRAIVRHPDVPLLGVLRAAVLD